MPPAPHPTSKLEDIPTTTTLLSKDTGNGYSKTTKQHRQDHLKKDTPLSEASVLIKSTSSLEQQLVVMENTKQRLDTILSRTAPTTLTVSPQGSVSKQLPLATPTSTYSTEGTYLPTYRPTYLRPNYLRPTYLPTLDLTTYLPTLDLTTYLPTLDLTTYLPALDLTTYLPTLDLTTYLPTYLRPNYLPTYLRPNYLPTYLRPNYLPTYLRPNYLP